MKTYLRKYHSDWPVAVFVNVVHIVFKYSSTRGVRSLGSEHGLNCLWAFKKHCPTKTYTEYIAKEAPLLVYTTTLVAHTQQTLFNLQPLARSFKYFTISTSWLILII